MTGDFEDATFCGEFGTFPMYNGYSIEGTITDKKQDSALELAILEGYRTGVMPDIVLMVSVGPAGSSKRERWSVSDVVFTEAALASIEAKKPVERELPFKAGILHESGGSGMKTFTFEELLHKREQREADQFRVGQIPVPESERALAPARRTRARCWPSMASWPRRTARRAPWRWAGTRCTPAVPSSRTGSSRPRWARTKTP